MAEKTQNKPGKSAPKGDVSEYIKSLSEEYRMLVVLKRNCMAEAGSQ